MLQLEADFNRLHPHKENLFFDRFETIRSHLIKRLDDCKNIRDIGEKAYVHLLHSTLICEFNSNIYEIQ